MRVGVRYEPEWKPSGLPAYARAAEELGYDELWFSEDCFWPGGMAMASAALAVTTRVEVGVGLFAAPVRNPTTVAMEISALAGLAPSRVTVAFGRGMAAWMKQIGALSPAPLELLEETVGVVRRLLAGDTVNISSRHLHLVDVQLSSPPAAPPPVLVGTTGPKGLAVAGRNSDGVVLPELSCPASVRWARSELAAAGSSGRMVVFAYLSLDDDASAAVAEVEPRIVSLARSGAFPHLVQLAEIDSHGHRPLDVERVQVMSVSGNPDDCARAVRRWQQCGVDVLVLIPRSHDGFAQVSRFAAEVLPELGLR